MSNLTSAEYEDAIRSLFRAWFMQNGSAAKIPDYRARNTRQIALDRVVEIMREEQRDRVEVEKVMADHA